MALSRAFLKEILTIPTAPYRERLVIDRLAKELAVNSVPHFEDASGNLVVGADGPDSYREKMKRRGNEPLRLFIAHTDHPGFHGVKWTPKGELVIRWHGGSPTKHLEGAAVWLADGTGYRGDGKLTQVKMHRSGLWIESAKVKSVSGVERKGCDAGSLFGAFRFRAPVWSQGQIYYTKAADDLVGSAVIVSLAIELWKSKTGTDNFLGVLTRAEEVGFIGCLAHFELGLWKERGRPVVAVSLETSRTLPGAIVGKGPVVRLGDRASIFDPRALEVLTHVAKKSLGKRFQRRVMDGGTCEGTVSTVLGLPTIGISIPLGNYHNQNFEGGPDARGKLGPAPEFVHLKDADGMLTLCAGLMAEGLSWEDPFVERRGALDKRLKDASELMLKRL